MAKNDLDDFLKELKRDMTTAVRTEVIEVMKDIQQETIDDVVYNSYSPSYYDRRGDEDGLRDRDNMKVDVMIRGDNMNIEMTNETRGNTSYTGSTNGYIADIIESGQGYWNSSLDERIGARPFQEETQNRIDSGSEIEKTIENTLKELGYDFE